MTRAGVTYTVTTFVNNDVSSGDTVFASDHNTQGALLAAVLNGGIDNNNISAGAGISTSKLASDGFLGAWQSWTPSWTNLTIGSATVTARYTQIGKTVTCYLRVTLNSSSVGTSPRFTLPVAAASHYNSANNILAIGYAEDNAVAGYNVTVGIHNSTSEGTLFVSKANTYPANATPITSSTPFSWGNNDYLNTTFTYEAA